MEKTIFEVKQLNASYGQEVILKNLDFSIKEGEVIGIIGESGIGKSTFLECLLGNIHQKVMMNASEMKFLEENWLTLSSKKRREYLRQDIGIIFLGILINLVQESFYVSIIIINKCNIFSLSRFHPIISGC